eukprot:m.166188 g.166188  ORF g.166188 m.166188 type:complete len:505 (+) comp16615_c0_seq1:244-1758(+)
MAAETAFLELTVDDDRYFTPSPSPAKPYNMSSSAKQSPLGHAVLVAEDMNNNPSYQRMDLINRMAEELRATQQQLQQSQYECSRLQDTLRDELIEHESDSLVLSALKQEASADQALIRTLKAKVTQYEEQSPDVGMSSVQLRNGEAHRPGTPTWHWDDSVDLDVLQDSHEAIDLQTRCDLAELRIAQLEADRDRVACEFQARETSLLQQCATLQNEVEEQRSTMEGLRCTERDALATCASLHRDVAKHNRVAEAARRKVLLLSDQLEAKTSELQAVLSEQAELEDEIGRVTPDFRREAFQQQRSFDDMVSPQSWSFESGRTSPLDRPSATVLTCDVGCQAVVKVETCDVSSQAHVAGVSIGCQGVAHGVDASVQVTQTGVGCGTQTSDQLLSAFKPRSPRLLPPTPSPTPLPTPRSARLPQLDLSGFPSASSLHQTLTQVPEALAQQAGLIANACHSWVPRPRELSTQWNNLRFHTGLDAPVVKMAWIPVAGLCIMGQPFAVGE